MASVLEVKNLTKTFGKFQAVKGISFELAEGEVLGLLGPNGAGKTTTLQMLLGVMTPTQGSVHYFGMPLAHKRSEILENVNFSSTYVDLPYDLTIREVLNYTSHFYNIEHRKERIQKVLMQFKLEELVNKKINDLSAGQSTRLNLAKSFINNPKVLLLDEPTASLDPDVANYIRKFLLQKREQHSLSVIITSHNMAEVTELCDRVIFINHGKIVANDTPENLARSIKNAKVELLFGDQIEQAIKFMNDGNYIYAQEGKWLTITIDEYKIAEFLQTLQGAALTFFEINILKPTLEDYFLKLTKENAKTT
jgi:ABC-2 type transport system ATP-binding protein